MKVRRLLLTSTGIFVIILFFQTMLFAQPTLTSPSDGATGVSIQPTLKWSAGSANEQLQIARTNTFTTTVLSKSFTGSETTYTLTESEKLDNDSTYYWRVSTDGGTTWSSVFSFKTIAQISVTQSWPSANAKVYTTTTYFTWYAYSSTSIKYKIQVTSKTSGGNADWTQTPDFEATTGGYYYVFTLLAGQTYYWRVIVLNSSNEVLSYSSSVKFTTAGGAEVPSLSYPTNNSTVYYNPPTFSWYIQSVGTDVTYDIQVDNDHAFGSPEVDVTNINTVYYRPSSSFSAGTYYWKVRSVYKRGSSNEVTSNWSTIDTFTVNSSTNLTTPVISYPKGGVTVYNTSPYLYWYLTGSSSGISFEVWYKDSTAASFTKANSSDITTLYYQLSGLTAGKTYQWYVIAKDGSSTKQSSTETFKVYQSTSGAPVASYPTNGETVYSYKPTLLWYLNGSSTGLTKYTVRWKADSNSSDWNTDYDGSSDITNLNTTQYTFTSNLTYGKTYYWAVAAYNGSSYTSWSGGSFVVFSSSTVTPTLSYPVGGVTVYSTSVTLSWYLNGSSVGIQSYEVHYSNDNFSSNDVTVSPNPTTTSTTITGLTKGNTYSWKVKAIYSSSLSSGFSSVGTFTVDPGASPVQPLPGSPNNVTIESTTSPTISWILPAKSQSSLTYELQLADNPDFRNAKTFNGLNSPYSIVNNLTGGKYFWRTRSKNSNGVYSDYSPIAKFNVSKVTAVKEPAGIIPAKFAVYQNFPNPFNPSTIIKFDIPRNEYVEVSVFNLLGQIVSELFNGQLKAGTHQITFNARDLPSGIYFYRVKAGDELKVQKMILMK